MLLSERCPAMAMSQVSEIAHWKNLASRTVDMLRQLLTIP